MHETLSTIADADEAVNQLIALAIRNGGPDNITCIVADVIDTAAGPVAPTVEARLAGARPPTATSARCCQAATRGPAGSSRPARA